jgi:hypothetical protein
MIPLKAKLQRLKPPDVIQRFFNTWVREGFELAAAWWIQQRLPAHFAETASEQYGYPQRSVKYLIRKALLQGNRARASGLRNLLGSRKYARAKDTSAFVLTGRMKAAALSRAKGKGFATSNGAKLEITVPVGFAGVHAGNAGMITKLLPAESRQMRRMVVDYVARKVAEFNGWREAA